MDSTRCVDEPDNGIKQRQQEMDMMLKGKKTGCRKEGRTTARGGGIYCCFLFHLTGAQGNGPPSTHTHTGDIPFRLNYL